MHPPPVSALTSAETSLHTCLTGVLAGDHKLHNLSVTTLARKAGATICIRCNERMHCNGRPGLRR